MRKHTTQKRYPHLFGLALVLILTLTLAACVPDAAPEAVVVEPGEELVEEEALTTAFGVADFEGGMMPATVMLDRTLTTATGEDLGEIEDLLIDASSGNLLFARVEHGGFLDIGDSEVLVPLSALQWNAADEHFMLMVDAAAFASWPELGEGWADPADDTWDDSLVEFWEGAGIDMAWDPMQAMPTVIWATDLMENGLDFDIDRAEIENLLLDLAQGQVRYALVSADETLFGDTNLRAVPFTALNITIQGDGIFAIDPAVDTAMLAAAPSIAPTAFDGILVMEEGWDDELATYWADYDYLVDVGASDAAVGGIGSFGVVGAENVMMLATAILDQEVDNVIGEELGDIEDVFIDAGTGNVLFATIEHGGFLDIGDEDLPVPLSALSWNAAEEELVLPITEEQLERFPEIEDDWELTLDPGWREVTDFWRNSAFNVMSADEIDLNNVILASQLVSYGIGAFDTPGLANVQNLIIDLQDARVKYALVSFLDAGVYGGDWRIVPYSAFDPAAFGNELVFAEEFNLDLLVDAPTISEAAFYDIDMLDPTWDDEVAAFWEEAGYETDVD